jgi:hypothetical protein
VERAPLREVGREHAGAWHFSTPEVSGHCPEWNRLFGVFVAAICELLSLEMGDLADQALPRDQSEGVFLHHAALARKYRAKRDLIAHIQSHASCADKLAAA